MHFNCCPSHLWTQHAMSESAAACTFRYKYQNEQYTDSSNNVKPLGKRQRDLGGLCRGEGASLFSSPNFPSTANLTLLNSWDLSTDMPWQRDAALWGSTAPRAWGPLPRSPGTHCTSLLMSLLTAGTVLSQPLWCNGSAWVPLFCQQGSSSFNAKARHICSSQSDGTSRSQALRGTESTLFVLEVQILSLVTTHDKCHSWRDNLT